MILEKLCSVFTDGDWIESKDQSPSGIRLIQTGNIGEGVFLDKEERAKYISEATFEELKCTEIFPGDILISRLPDPVGRACIVPDKEERMITAVDCSICRVKNDLIDTRYLCYYLQSNQYYKQLDQNVTGTTRKRISRKNLGNVEVTVPALDKQYEVVQILDKVSSAILDKKKQLELFDELIKSRFVELFGDPVKNDMGWEATLLKNATSKIGSGATPKGGKESYQTEGITLIRSMNVHDGRFEYKDLAHITDEQAKQLDNVTIEENDVFINITGASVARSCIVPKHILPARVNQHVAIIRCITTMLNPVFANNMFLNHSFKGQLLDIGETGGATRQAITKQQLETLEVILPPIELQNQFADFVEQTDKSKVAIQKSLDEMQVLYDKLMQEYFG